jgi:hypothetical protein
LTDLMYLSYLFFLWDASRFLERVVGCGPPWSGT